MNQPRPALLHLQTVAETFAGNPEIAVEIRSQSVVIRPQSGFPITVYEDHGESMVAAMQWHTHFDDPSETVACVQWLLTPYTRIVHELKGGLLAAVWIERSTPAGWQASDPVYFLNPEYPPEWKLLPTQSYYHRVTSQAALPVDVSGLERAEEGTVTIQVSKPYGITLFDDIQGEPEIS